MIPMANIPSVQTIQDRLIDYHAQWLEMPRKRAAKIVREAMEVAEGRIPLDDARTLVEWASEPGVVKLQPRRLRLPRVEDRIKEGWAHHWFRISEALDAVDVLLDGHGIEHLSSVDGSDPIAYVNMGDPYIPTVLYDYEKNRFYVTDWGAIVEGDEDRFRERSDQPGEGW